MTLSACRSLIYSFGAVRWRRAIEWIASGKINVEPLESRHFDFNDYADAYRFIDREGDKTMKVLIDVND